MLKRTIERTLLSSQKEDVIGLEAATGSGKTCGTLETVMTHAPFFGRTLVILPTSMACSNLLKTVPLRNSLIEVVPIHKGVQKLLQSRLLRYPTIIVDEAHETSNDYAMLFHLLGTHKRRRVRPPLRVVFLSATLPEFCLREFFPTLVIQRMPGSTPFPVQVMYEDTSFVGFHGNVRKDRVYQATVRRIQELYPDHRRILVFMATHMDCETIHDKLSGWSKEKEVAVRILHGGLESEEKEEVLKRCTMVEKSFVLIATNIVESAVTIPLDAVVDSGIECRPDNNRFEIVYASKDSMIQRAGRVGRLCKGTVFRILSEEDYEQKIPLSRPLTCDMDRMVLQIINQGLNPYEFLGEDASVSLEALQNFGISISGPSETSRFVEKSGLLLRNALLLYPMETRFCSEWPIRPFPILSVFVTTLIDYYDTKYPRWIYFPRKTWGDRVKIMDTLRRDFSFEGDMLVSFVHMLLTVYINDKWRNVASYYSMNQKTLREFYQHFRRVASRFWPDVPLEDLLETLRLGLRPQQKTIVLPGKEMGEKDVECDISIVRLSRALLFRLRSFLWTNPYFSKEDILHTSMASRSDFSLHMSVYYSILSIHPQVFRSPVILGIPHKTMEDVILWTNPPWNIPVHHKQIMKQAGEFQQRKASLQQFRDTVLVEIREEVAYRPGMVSMQEIGDHFYHLASFK